MKVYFDKIYQLDLGYQEMLIDENNFREPNYVDVSKTKQHIHGLMYEDVYTLEPLGYYKIKLSVKTPCNFTKFQPAIRLLEVGLIISNINTNDMSIFVYNSTHNCIFLRPKAVIGEIE